MSSVVIIGTQWGDEGKGKIVDFLAEHTDYVVRSQGGSNAGHTVVVNGVKYKLRLLPSGILYKGKICILGNGVVIDPKVFLAEIEGMKEKGIDTSLLKISTRAHIIMPYHKILDELQEEELKEDKLGTTKNGIGPCYMDKAARIGIRVIDLIDDEEFEKKLKFNINLKNKTIEGIYKREKLNYEAILKEYREYAKEFRKYAADTSLMLANAFEENKKILFEGAQATMLDIDFGTYPFVTSSNPTAAGMCVGSGVGPRKIDTIVGVVKAYSTRVGEGPFPSELTDEIGDRIRERGQEFGTVTGRKRRCGWLDAAVIKYAAYINSLDYLAITRLDILDGLDEIKMCVGYECDGTEIKEYPSNLKMLSKVKPIYKTFKCWKEDTSKIREYDKLPKEAKIYLEALSDIVKVKIGIVSVGAARDATILKDDFKKVF